MDNNQFFVRLLEASKDGRLEWFYEGNEIFSARPRNQTGASMHVIWDVTDVDPVKGPFQLRVITPEGCVDVVMSRTGATQLSQLLTPLRDEVEQKLRKNCIAILTNPNTCTHPVKYRVQKGMPPKVYTQCLLCQSVRPKENDEV